MTNERFCEILGDMNVNQVEEARTLHKAPKPAWRKWAIMAACFCLAAMAGVLYSTRQPQDFNAMLTETAVDAIVTITELKIDDRVACYEKVDIDESRLKAYVGTPYQQVGNDVWSYPADVDNLKYLIRQSGDGALSLWVFSSFVVSDGDTYTYGDVLRVIYGVDSAEEIVCITAAPSKSNNTDLGRRIQKEVGTHTYTDAEDLAAFYGIAVDVKCFGADSESIGDPNRFTYSFSTDEQDKLTSGESTYATRVFSITLANGTTIDSWRYDALQGCFFEFGGIFTEPLPAEAVEILNRMFGIE